MKKINKYLTILFAKLTVHFFNKVTGGGANVTGSELLKANLDIWVWSNGVDVSKLHSVVTERKGQEA